MMLINHNDLSVWLERHKEVAKIFSGPSVAIFFPVSPEGVLRKEGVIAGPFKDSLSPSFSCRLDFLRREREREKNVWGEGWRL